jgi:regulator of replication initiation timing
LVSDLAGSLERVEQELSELRTHNQALHEEVERLRLENSNLHASNQALKDEIARSRTCRRARRSDHQAWRKLPSRGRPNPAGTPGAAPNGIGSPAR